MTVYNEEKALYSDTSNIYIARYNHKIIGSIRVFKWDRKKELPIERMYGINPLKTISHEKYAEYWHIINLGESIYYLSSETVPIYASQEGITPFYQHYLGLCNSA